VSAWRLIPSSAVPTLEKPSQGKSPVYPQNQSQMAYDQELFQRFQPGEPPILRFFFFERPTLTLGRLEARRMDLSRLPYPYEIRPTGGRAVLHGEKDLCYSIIASTQESLVGGELLESYRKISGLLAYALRGLDRSVKLSNEKHAGLEADHCFSAPSHGELTLQGKKVAGGAQAREGGKFLQQGVLLLSVAEGWKDLFPGTLESPMTGLNDDPSLPLLSRADVEGAIMEAFQETGVTFEKHFAPAR